MTGEQQTQLPLDATAGAPEPSPRGFWQLRVVAAGGCRWRWFPGAAVGFTERGAADAITAWERGRRAAARAGGRTAAFAEDATIERVWNEAGDPARAFDSLAAWQAREDALAAHDRAARAQHAAVRRRVAARHWTRRGQWLAVPKEDAS